MRVRRSQYVVWIVLLVVASLPCFAAEVAVLRNGFSIKHERREIVGDLTRLYVTVDGSSFIDVPTVEIEHFEEAPPEPVEDPASSPKSGALRPTSGGKPSGIPQRPVDLSQVVNEASGRYRLDPDLVNSVIKAESDFKVRAVSPKGAQGLMQLMPGTADQLGVTDPFDPKANIEAGTAHLNSLLNQYHDDPIKALAAYNAGAHRVEQYHGVPPYRETRAYVARIVRDFNAKKRAQMGASQVAAAKKTGTNNNLSKKTATARKTTTKKKLRQANA